LFLLFFRFLHVIFFLVFRYWYLFLGILAAYYLVFKGKKAKDVEDKLDPDKELNIKPKYKVEEEDEQN
jgi:predicted membrane protein